MGMTSVPSTLVSFQGHPSWAVVDRLEFQLRSLLTAGLSLCHQVVWAPVLALLPDCMSLGILVTLRSLQTGLWLLALEMSETKISHDLKDVSWSHFPTS